MFMLGKIYQKGAEGIKRDFQKVTELKKRGAVSGNEYAMDELGVMYYNGREQIQRDRGRAYVWYKRAALKGYTPAMVHIASMYNFGIAPVDKDKGIEWLGKASDKGDEQAPLKILNQVMSLQNQPSRKRINNQYLNGFF